MHAADHASDLPSHVCVLAHATPGLKHPSGWQKLISAGTEVAPILKWWPRGLRPKVVPSQYFILSRSVYSAATDRGTEHCGLTETPREAVHLLHCCLGLCLLLVLREFAAVLLLDCPEAASVVGFAAALLGDTPDNLLHHLEVLPK